MSMLRSPQINWISHLDVKQLYGNFRKKMAVLMTLFPVFQLGGVKLKCLGNVTDLSAKMKV